MYFVHRYSKAGKVLKQGILDGKLAPTDAQIDRKLLMGFRPYAPKTAEQIAQAFKDQENEVYVKNSDL